MLCGPDAFFRKAKHIMPWHDDDDEDDGEPQGPPPTISRRVMMHSVQIDRRQFDGNPFSDLPCDWRVQPEQMGVSVAVLPPSIVACKILRHCKETGSNPL